MIASIEWGPLVATAFLNCWSNSATVVALLDLTPKPSARATQLMGGLDKFVRFSAWLAEVTFCFSSSKFKMLYFLLEHITVITSRPSLACVQSAWGEYSPLPSA